VTSQQACYLYGIVSTEVPHPVGMTGVHDSNLEFVAHDGIAAVISALDVERPLGKHTDLLAHSRVLDALAAHGAVVPVRFGSVLPDRADVVPGVLKPGLARFRDLLDDLSGRVQFNLRARYDEQTVLTEVVTANPAIAKLREQTRGKPEAATYYARMRLGELVAHELAGLRKADSGVILDTLAPHTVAQSVRDGEGVDHLMYAAFLVDTAQRAAFEEAAESIAATLNGRATLQLTGPLAPYDFVTRE